MTTHERLAKTIVITDDNDPIKDEATQKELLDG